MPPSYPLKGIPLPTVPDPNHPIPVRQDIDVWYSNPDNAVQVSLFIQAMIKFQKTDFNNQLSYYQVSGIHSLPVAEWDNVPGGEYCNHNTATFPTWHRPYVLLFEQILYELMLEIIEKDVPEDEKKLWKISASHWRFPYWDWAVKSKLTQNYSVPQLLTIEKVTIKMPHLKTQTVENPLWQFTNPAGIPMGDKRMGKYAITIVDPNNPATPYWVQCIATSKFGVVKNTPPEKWIHGVQNWEKANDALQHPAWYDLNDTTGTAPPLNLGSIGEAVYRMFSPNYFDSWQAFASTLYNEKNPGGKNFLSLEYIHNNIHSFAGGVDLKTGIGQMGDVPVAAFDPIFWLHHCNVDRQCAIWQTLNPDKWFDAPTPGDNLPTDPLKPFHTDTQSTFWTSEKTRDWTKLGYQYDDLEPPKHTYSEHGEVDRSLYLPLIKKVLNECYTTRDQLLNAPDIDGCKNDYIVNILYDRYALNGKSYSIYFFIGTVEGEANSYALHPNQVGSVYTFSSGVDLSQPSSCSNCKQQKESGAMSMAQIHITVPLLKHAQDPAKENFNDLTTDAVTEYLTANLHWKATSAGEPISMDQLPRTKIYVLKGTAEHTPDVNHLSHYLDYSPIWEACQGKPGAGHPADGLE